MMILASDYDGTFHIGEEQTIKNVQAVKKWRAAGNQFGLVTGRSLETVSLPAEEYKIPLDFMICTNGASIFGPNRRLLADTPMENAGLKRLMQLPSIRKSDRCFALTGRGTFARCRPGKLLDRIGLFRVPSVDEKEIPNLQPVWQISVACGDLERAMGCAKEVNDTFPGVYSAYDNIDSVDIVAFGMNKSQGIRRYLEACGFKEESEKILVIGDGGNDVDMLRTFGGFTVTNGCPSAKAAAAGVFDSVEALIETALKEK